MGTLFDPLGTVFERSAVTNHTTSHAFAYDSGGLHGGPGREGVGGPYPSYDISRIFFMLVSPQLSPASIDAHQQNNRIHARVETISLVGTGLLAGTHAARAGGTALSALTAPPASCEGLTGGAIGVDDTLQWLSPPRDTLPTSRRTHNVLTVTDGVLLVTVAFGTGGDDDQYLGVLPTPAPERAPFTHLRDHGVHIKEGIQARIHEGGASHAGKAWRLKGHSVSLRLDVPARSLSFWSTAGMHGTLDLDRGSGGQRREWTVAIGLFNNSATVMAGRWFRSEALEVA